MALDPTAVAPVAHKATHAGKPVVAISTDLGGQNQSALVSASEHEMGYLLGQQAGKWAKKHTSTRKSVKIGLLVYAEPFGQIVEREKAIIEGIKDEFGANFNIIRKEIKSSPAEGLVEWLNLHPDMNVIIGITDGLALDAYQAVIAVNKNDPDTFFVGGVDAVDDALMAIKSAGAYQATVTQSPRQMGALAIRILVAAIKGLVYEKITPIKHVTVNLSNVDEFLNKDRQVTGVETATEDILTGLDSSPIKVGLSILNMTNPFFVAVVDGAKKEAERLGIQLVINDPKRVLGVLDVQSDIAGLLNVEDQLVLEGLCAQIAAAIESTRLRQEMEDRLRELNALQRLMSREGWQAFQAAREQAAQAYLFDQTSVRATTIDKLQLTYNGTPQKELINGTAEDNDHIVAMPIAVRGEIIGALGIQNDADGPLSLEDRAFLDAVAEQVAEALERARLLEQTQKRAVEMETVAQLSSVVSTILDTAKLLQEVVDLTKERFGLYHAHIYLLNEAGDTLNLAAGAGEVGRQMMAQGWSLPLTQKHSLVAQAVRTRQTVIANDVYQNPDFMSNPLLPETHSEMAVPLIGGDSVLGVLDVQADVVNRFTDEDIHVQTTLATQVAVALQNARLYAETAERATELETLSQISRRLSVVLDPQQLIAEVVEQVGVAFNYYYTQIYLFDQARENLVLTGGSGETGRLLLARQHSLPKGRGLVGRAAEQNKIVLIPDVRRSIRPEIISQANLEDVYRRETDPVVEAEWYAQYIAQYFGDVKALRDWLMVNPERAGKALKLGYVLHVPGVFPKMIQRGVEAAAHDLQVEVEFVAPLRQGAHLPLFEAMVRQGKDGLVVVPDRPEWIEPIRQAMAANIPVVTANRDLKFSPALMHVGLDNFQAGVMLAGELVKLLRAAGKKKGKILVSTGIPDRNAGVRHSLRDMNYTLIEIEGFLEDISFLQTYWEQALNRHPDLIAVMGLTASEPPILAEIKRRTGGQWLLVGFDLELATLEAIREGIVQVTIGQHPYLQAYLPILALVERLRLDKSLEGWMAEGWLPMDVQHNVAGSLKPENANLLRSVADQVAVALQNAHLFAQTEAALAEVQQSQELLRVTIDATPDWIFIKDRNHRYHLVNQGYANSLYTTPENMIGKNDLELGFPEDIVKGNPELGIRGFWPDDLEVMESGKPKFIEVEPAFVDGHPVFLSTIKVPLHDAGGNVWGVLGFVRDITQREQLLAEVENLYKASRRINEAKDLQEIVAAVAEAGPVPIINRILLFTFERNLLDQVEAMTVVANWHSGQGTPPSPIGRRYGRDAFSTVGLMLSPEPLFFNDVQHDERMDVPIIAVAQQQNIRAMAVLPLQIGGRELGVLILQAEEIHEFTAREIQFYQSLSPPIAVAIDNQRLLAETRAALAEVEQTQRRYTLQAWEVYRDKLTTLSYEQTREGVTPLGDNLLPEITQTIAQSRRSRTNSEVQVILSDQHAEDSSQQTKPDSSLIVPLTVRGETIGVLGLQEIDDQRVWSPEEISLIGAICEQLAQAAENIRLIDETQQRAAREKRVNEIGEKIQTAQSLEEALQIAVKEVGLSLQAPQTIVQLDVK
ncbi:MAG: GAF domain-containing protein [Chloroflexi bacterium]|nr:GAF domain-containing protein [Chloroflexota bacterium]